MGVVDDNVIRVQCLVSEVNGPVAEFPVFARGQREGSIESSYFREKLTGQGHVVGSKERSIIAIVIRVEVVAKYLASLGVEVFVEHIDRAARYYAFG